MDRDITVPVPEERVAEFFSMYGAWLAGSPEGADREGGTEYNPVAWDADSVDDAAWVYRKLSDRGKALFDLLMDNAGQMYTPEDLARRLDIPNGSYGVAGTLAWPGRYCVQRNRRFPIEWEGPDGSTMYHMMKPVAAVFRAARETVVALR